jgi:DNA-directed RNA polymerase subunit beta'
MSKQNNLSPIFQKLQLMQKANSADIVLKLNNEKKYLDFRVDYVAEEFHKSQILDIDLMNGYSKIQELKLVKIGLASSEQIIQWAEKLLPNGKVFGEVLNANTLHYKTFRPHKGGLFCERIFGPLKDFECACGIKQKPFEDDDYVENLLDAKKIKRIFCSNCDVEYTWSVIRRYQLGYIQLAAPVSHLWYLKTNPSYLSLLLDMQKRDLESIVYCMQITTLEYYWKPLYALQMNLDASALFRTYKNFLKIKTNNKTNNFLLKQKPQLTKKQKKENQKRKQLSVKRQHYYLTSTTIEKIESLKYDSLQKQIQYLEKSFQLSTTDLSTNTFSQTSNITRFLQQNISRKIKKKTFLRIYQIFVKDFYTRIFKALRTRYAKNLSKPQLFFENVKDNDLDREANKKKSKSSKLAFFFKNELKFNEKRKNSFKASFIDLQKQLEFFFFYSNKNSILFLSLPRKITAHKSLENGAQLQPNKNFLSLLSRFLTKNYLKQSWTLINLKTLQKTHFFYFLKKDQINSNLLSKSKEFLSHCFFLSFLIIVQEKNDSFLKPKPFAFYIEHIMFYLRFIKSDNKMFQKNQKLQNFEFLSEFLQTNCLMTKPSKTMNFFEIKTLCSNTKEPLFLLLTSFVQRWLWVIIKHRNCKSKFFKKLHLIRESLNLEKKVIEFEGHQSLKLKSKQLFLINYQTDLMNPSRFWKKKTFQKKSCKFLKQGDIYVETFFDLSKTMNLQRDFLIKEKEKLHLKKGQLINNLYTIPYSKGWISEKDWKYFLYYNTSAIEITDTRLIHYNHRFMESDHLTLPVIGANFIEKILEQYQGLELKKMAKQTQIIVPKLNRYIRFKKQKAMKKTELIEIQKLLQKRDEMIRRLKLFRKLFKKNSKATSMILNTLPVLPPDLRPILKMQNQIAASDLNRFYQRILYRNDRLKKFLRSNGTWMYNETGFEIKYAHRLLQEAVDNLIQNGKGTVKPETNSRGQPLKSLSEILKGKQGRFRQYLLGKRVDYSGRSVIVVGPKLKIYECGLPFEMAIELFLPFLIKKIFQYKLAKTIVGAKTILKTQLQTTWTLLEEVMQNHPILLNRAPTLHRLGIQSFQPKLIEGRAIFLHPLVCPAFNADFDGDQMAVHVPITVEARTEAWKLMFSRNHLISPATGEPMLLPSQDMVLGCYYLTTEYFQRPRFNENRLFRSPTRFYFGNTNEVLQAYFSEKIHLQTPIWIKWNGLLQTDDVLSKPLEIRLTLQGSWTELRPKSQKVLDQQGSSQNFFIRTTAGRVLFNTLIQTCIQKT